jgi:hypothetical protein
MGGDKSKYQALSSATYDINDKEYFEFVMQKVKKDATKFEEISNYEGTAYSKLMVQD